MDDDLIFNFATQAAPTSKSNNNNKGKARENAASASRQRQQHSQNHKRPQQSIQKVSRVQDSRRVRDGVDWNPFIPHHPTDGSAQDEMQIRV